MAIPSSSFQPGLPEIWQELQDLRLELAALRQILLQAPSAAGRSELQVGERLSATSEPPARQASAATLLGRRNGERLQQEVRRRLDLAASQLAGQLDSGQPDSGPEDSVDTEVDLLIDRLHELADAASAGP